MRTLNKISSSKLVGNILPLSGNPRKDSLSKVGLIRKGPVTSDFCEQIRTSQMVKKVCNSLKMMHVVLFYLMFGVTLCAELPTATVIRYEYKSVLGPEETTEERIFVNGDLFTPEGSENGLGVGGFIPSSNFSPSLQDALKMFAKTSNSTQEDNTFQRFRECNLKGFQVMRVNEWIEHNGEDVLFLDQSTDAWATLHPQAMPLKQELDRERQRTVRDRMRFQQACAELAKILRRTEATSGGGMAGVLAPLLAVVIFLGLILVSFIISKQSSAPPGAVLGSIIHYPPPNSDGEQAVRQPSVSIKAPLLDNMP
ncbi:uncharacterized protein LOC134465255 [Engraulis encrasicolus]|uniref:uncharacterized protein LOC134465255 n=1 Tax=Engraulis encrasicolus TaxID=184585 RepID=UPI002FD2FA84